MAEYEQLSIVIIMEITVKLLQIWGALGLFVVEMESNSLVLMRIETLYVRMCIPILGVLQERGEHVLQIHECVELERRLVLFSV